MRTRFAIPLGVAADVAPVQDDASCEAATAGVEAGGTDHHPEALIVVRIGRMPSFYLATARPQGGRGAVYVLDGMFTLRGVLVN